MLLGVLFFYLIIFTMHQLRFKLALISSLENVEEGAEKMRRSLKQNGLIFLTVVLLYTTGLLIGMFFNDSLVDYNMIIISASNTLNLIALTSCYFYVMTQLRQEIAKFDQSGIKRELKLVKLQQWIIGVLSLLGTLTSLTKLIYLLAMRDEEEVKCQDTIYRATICGQPIWIVFEALPRALIMASHIKFFHGSTGQKLEEAAH